jgi:hypothetical protein
MKAKGYLIFFGCSSVAVLAMLFFFFSVFNTTKDLQIDEFTVLLDQLVESELYSEAVNLISSTPVLRESEVIVEKYLTEISKNIKENELKAESILEEQRKEDIENLKSMKEEITTLVERELFSFKQMLMKEQDIVPVSEIEPFSVVYSSIQNNLLKSRFENARTQLRPYIAKELPEAMLLDTATYVLQYPGRGTYQEFLIEQEKAILQYGIKYPFLYYSIGKAFEYESELSSSIYYIEKAYENGINNWTVLYTLGNLYAFNGQYDESFRMYMSAYYQSRDKQAALKAASLAPLIEAEEEIVSLVTAIESEISDEELLSILVSWSKNNAFDHIIAYADKTENTIEYLPIFQGLSKRYNDGDDAAITYWKNLKTNSELVKAAALLSLYELENIDTRIFENKQYIRDAEEEQIFELILVLGLYSQSKLDESLYYYQEMLNDEPSAIEDFVLILGFFEEHPFGNWADVLEELGKSLNAAEQDRHGEILAKAGRIWG